MDGPRLGLAQVQAMVQRNPQLPSIFRHYNQYEDLVVLDTLPCPAYKLVSVLWRHEDCCEDLYYLTTTPDGKGVLDSLRVAARGMDGQWHQESLLQTAADGSLRVISLEENSTDDENQPGLLDSVATFFAVTPQGRFMQKPGITRQRALRRGEHLPEQR